MVIYGSDPVYWPDRTREQYGMPFVNNGAHEEAHTRQSEILGPFYLPLQLLGGAGKATNPLERGANVYGQRKTCDPM